MSEFDIDMERAMQGIDDADSHVPKITWTNCADAMPPDDVLVIVKSWTGNIFKLTRYALNSSVALYGAENYKWTPYTLEKWEELNK